MFQHRCIILYNLAIQIQSSCYMHKKAEQAQISSTFCAIIAQGRETGEFERGWVVGAQMAVALITVQMVFQQTLKLN